jgi:putative ABC transport system ATP-binding protein
MDLEVEPGEFVAVVGPSGCGKSRLLHLIAALDRPDSGTMRVADHDLVHESNLDHYRARHVGMIFQLHNLLPTLNALENVQIPVFELDLGAPERAARSRARWSRSVRTGSSGCSTVAWTRLDAAALPSTRTVRRAEPVR